LGKAVRAIEKDAEQKKRDLKTKLPTQKTFNQPFERSERTNSDRREQIIYCWSSTIGNASRRIAGLAGRSLAAFGHAAGSVTDQPRRGALATRSSTPDSAVKHGESKWFSWNQIIREPSASESRALSAKGQPSVGIVNQ